MVKKWRESPQFSIISWRLHDVPNTATTDDWGHGGSAILLGLLYEEKNGERSPLLVKYSLCTIHSQFIFPLLTPGLTRINWSSNKVPILQEILGPMINRHFCFEVGLGKVFKWSEWCKRKVFSCNFRERPNYNTLGVGSKNIMKLAFSTKPFLGEEWGWSSI